MGTRAPWAGSGRSRWPRALVPSAQIAWRRSHAVITRDTSRTLVKDSTGAVYPFFRRWRVGYLPPL